MAEHHRHHHGHDHGHEHDHSHGHSHTHGIIDPALATNDRGLWAVKWSFVALVADRLPAAHRRVLVRQRRPARRHHPQFRRCRDRDPARHRVRAGRQASERALHLRLRADRGPGGRRHRADHPGERHRGRLREHRPLPASAGCLASVGGDRGLGHRLSRQRAGGDLPHPGRARDQQRRPGCRRLPRPHRRLDQPGGAVRGARASGSATRWPTRSSASPSRSRSSASSSRAARRSSPACSTAPIRR